MGSMECAKILTTHRTDMETGKGEGCDIDEAPCVEPGNSTIASRRGTGV